MAKIKLLTIAVENRPGAVAEIAKIVGNAKVNILSLLATAQGSSGTLHLVVDGAKRARKALEEARVAYQETSAEEYQLANKPGALAGYLSKLAARGVNLSSIHATASKSGKKAVVVYSVEAKAATAEAKGSNLKADEAPSAA